MAALGESCLSISFPAGSPPQPLGRHWKCPPNRSKTCKRAFVNRVMQKVVTSVSLPNQNVTKRLVRNALDICYPDFSVF